MTDKLLIDRALLEELRDAANECRNLSSSKARDVYFMNLTQQADEILERQEPRVEVVEVVAHCAFADNGNIRMWGRSASTHCELVDSEGSKAVPLMTVAQHNRIVKQLASK